LDALTGGFALTTWLSLLVARQWEKSFALNLIRRCFSQASGCYLQSGNVKGAGAAATDE